jgi:methionine-rich copper-binding protein CopC
MTRRQFGRRALTIVPLAWLGSAALALAHAALVRSIPAARAELRRPPDRVQLWFNERLEPGYSSLSVVDGTGQRVDGQDARVAPEDEKLLAVSLPALPAGRYTVRYRVLSVDGHVVQSEFSFMVLGADGRR